jgi:hypothetical protein
MAVGDATIGLLFRMTADSSGARSDISSLRAVYTGNVDAIVRSLVNYAVHTRDVVAATQQNALAARGAALSFQVLEGAFVNQIGGLRQARSLLSEFSQALKLAAGGNRELATTFATVGVNLSDALRKPAQGLQQFLAGFSALSDQTQKAEIAQAVFLSSNKNLVPALDAAAAGMRGLTVTEGTATTGALALNAALFPITVTIGLIVAAVGGLSLGVGALFNLAKGASETGKAVLELSDKTGISVRNIELLRIAAQEAGKDFNIVERSLDQFVTRLDDAARSSGKTEGALAFKRVGVEAAEGMRDANGALEQAIKSLNSYDNATNRAADAQRVFGLRNDQIATVLTRVSTSLDDYEARLNGVGKLTEEQARQAKSFDLSLNQLAAATSGLVRVIGARLIPVFQPWIDLTTTLVRLIGSNLTPIIRAMESATISVYPVLGRVVVAFFRAASSVDTLNASLRSAPAFVNVIKAALADGAEVFGRFARIVGSTGNVVQQFVTGNVTGAAAASAQVAQQIGTIFDGVGQRTQAALVVARTAVKANLAEIIANRNRIEKEGRGKDLDLTKAPKKEKNPEDEARNSIRLLELQEQSVTRLANAEVAAARRAFEARTISLADLERITIETENRMLTAKLAVFAEERRQVDLTKLKAGEKEIKLAEIGEREAAARQQVSDKIAQVEAERDRREDAARARSRDKALQTSDERTKAEIEAIRNEADQRVINYEQAERRIADLEQRRLQNRRGKAQDDFLAAGLNLEAQRAALDEIEKIDAERVKQEEQSVGRINEARQKDIENLRRYAKEVLDLRREIVRDQIATTRLEAEELERRAKDDPRLLGDAIRARYDASLEELRLRDELAKDRIAQDEAEALKTAATAQQKEEIERLSNERRLENEAQFNAQLAQLRQERANELAALDPTSNAALFGVNDESLTKLQAFGSVFQTVLSQVSASAGNFRTIVGGALDSVRSGLTSTLQAMIATRTFGVQAFKQLAVGAIAGIAAQSLVKAIFETAEGFAALARHDPASAALHFKSAATYGIVGAAAGGIAAALGGGGNTGGAESGANSGSASGAGAFNGSENRDITIRRNATAQEQENARLAAEIRDKAENGGSNRSTLLKLADAVEGLNNKIQGMSPGHVVGVGLNENPQAAGTAVIETARIDGGFVRQLSEAQGF